MAGALSSTADEWFRKEKGLVRSLFKRVPRVLSFLKDGGWFVPKKEDLRGIPVDHKGNLKLTLCPQFSLLWLENEYNLDVFEDFAVSNSFLSKRRWVSFAQKNCWPPETKCHWTAFPAHVPISSNGLLRCLMGSWKVLLFQYP